MKTSFGFGVSFYVFKIQLSDGLVQEAEKLLCQLICYTGEKKIRMKFIEGCIVNLAANRLPIFLSLMLKLHMKICSIFALKMKKVDAIYFVTIMLL